MQVKEISLVSYAAKVAMPPATNNDHITSLNEQRKSIRQPEFIFENGISIAEKKLEEYLDKDSSKYLSWRL